MHTIQPKKDRNVVSGTIDRSRVGTGHTAHRGGGGRHQDKRTKRNRTRSQQKRAALSGW